MMKKIVICSIILAFILVTLNACIQSPGPEEPNVGEDSLVSSTVTTEYTPSETEPEEEYFTLTAEGKSLCTVLMPKVCLDTIISDAVDQLVERVLHETGVQIGIDTVDTGMRSIYITVGKSEGHDGRDWTVVGTPDRISVWGGSLYSVCLALDRLAEEIIVSEGECCLPGSLSLTYTYAEDHTEDVLGSLDEKRAQLGNPNGRLMVISHRSEHINNPENSRAGIFCALALGADLIEIDLRVTKDGHYVLCHDETLTRTFNVDEFAGKEGYPESHKVSDWTLEQLQSLTMLKSEFNEKIVTFEEALRIVRGKGILLLDKTTAEKDRRNVYQIALKERAVNSIMYQLGSLPVSLLETIYQETGIRVPYLHYKNSIDEIAEYVETEYRNYPFTTQVMQVVSAGISPNLERIAKITKECRLYINTIGGQSKAGLTGDRAENWEFLFDCGYSMIQSDQPYKLLSYIKSREGSGVTYDLKYFSSPVNRHAIASLTFSAKKNGAIYYTLDGSEATTAGTKYGGEEIMLRESGMVKLLFVADSGEQYRIEFPVLVRSEAFYAMIGE